MRRFSEVKHERIRQLGLDMVNAASEIVEARRRVRWETREQDEGGKAAAAKKLRAEELEIRAKFGLLEDTKLYDSARRGMPLL
jgi:hypothetical protein